MALIYNITPKPFPIWNKLAHSTGCIRALLDFYRKSRTKPGSNAPVLQNQIEARCPLKESWTPNYYNRKSGKLNLKNQKKIDKMNSNPVICAYKNNSDKKYWTFQRYWINALYSIAIGDHSQKYNRYLRHTLNTLSM